MNVPIFVINLPIDVKRREAIETQLKNLGATFEIIPGIYGEDERVIERYDEARTMKDRGTPLTRGEKGCALAHALIYERIVKENIPHAVILEDDIVLPNNFLSIIESEVKKEHKKWDWLSFDYRYSGLRFLRQWFIATWITIKNRPLYFFYACLKVPYMIILCTYEEVREIFAKKYPRYAGAERFYRPLYNAGAYILSYEGAKKLLPFTNPIYMGADAVPNKARFKIDFNLYGYVPLVTRQNLATFGSNTLLSEEEWNKIIK